MANPSVNSTNSYQLSGPIDSRAFLAECERQFTGTTKWNRESEPDVLFVLGKLVSDPLIGDIRYAAYTLATIFVETSHTVRVTVRTKDRRGGARVHVLKQWRNFVPVKERLGGKDLRNYKDPVKIVRLPTGSVRLTEKDGDQWEINGAGVAKPISKNPQRGTTPNGPVSPVYSSEEGDEQVYWGRGYVQLTWWSNYVKAGTELGRGLGILIQPDLALDPDLAYTIMIRGLTTGRIFANGRTFGKYFTASTTDYVHARDMVNPGASLQDKQAFAVICRRFEAALTAARK